MLRRTGPPAGTPAKTAPEQLPLPTKPVRDAREEARQVFLPISEVVGYCVLLIRT